MTLKGTPLERLMPERIRRRRESLGLSGAELARRAHVTPAYVSQIEGGKRVPDVKVAVALARVLGDDEPLYAAWSRDFKSSDRSEGKGASAGGAWTSVYRAGRFDDDAAFRTAVRSGRDLPPPGRATAPLPGSPPEPLLLRSPAEGPRRASPAEAPPPVASAAALRESVEVEPGKRPGLAAPEGRALVSAPVVPPGVDPGEEDEVPEPLRVDRMVLDPRFLPAARLGRPFVFRADAEVARRVPDRVAPDDLVIVSRDLGAVPPGPDDVLALRRDGRLFLGRVARVGDRLLVLPPPGRTEMDDVGLAAGGPLKPRVAGEVVAVLKVRPR